VPEHTAIRLDRFSTTRLDPCHDRYMTSEPIEQTRLPAIELVPWSEDDLWLLVRTMGDPAMTVHLGGPETPEKLAERHQRYLERTGPGQILKILRPEDQRAVGSVLYWESSEGGETFYEIGWAVLPEFQGQGYATAVTLAAVDLAREEGAFATMHAFPNVENTASNAVCRKAGFSLLGTVDVEFPKGHSMTCNDWCIELTGPPE